MPETLIAALDELAEAYPRITAQPAFHDELAELLTNYAGRPTPLTLARRVTADLGGAAVYLKREDLAHTGAHKINNVLGQCLLARAMGKRRVIAETGAGQHGVATATACALFGLECVVYMGAEDVERQALNVFRMELLGARVESVTSGSQTLKDATNEALRDWVTNVRGTYYCIGSVMGPHPYPTIVRDFQRVIGVEARRQILEATGRLPDVLVACVGGGSNAIGLFHPFLEDASVRLVGVEAAGEGLGTSRHGAALCAGEAGVLHGMKSLLSVRRRRADLPGPLDLGRARLSGRRAGARLPARQRSSRIHGRDGRRGARRLPLPVAPGGDHPGARVRARARDGAQARAAALARGDADREPLGPRGQGRAAGPRAAPRARSGPALMGRIGDRFASLRARGERALIPFLTAGDPDLASTQSLVLALAQAGADLIEIGIPFSDPLGDGPVIQRANERALRSGTSLRRVLELVKTLRPQLEVPLVLMGYTNPILAMGERTSPRRRARSVSTA